MAEIELYNRRSLPPSRTGQVKPPDIPEIDTVSTIAGFAGEIFGKLVQLRSANEQSEFLGAVSLAQEKANTAMADNPGMSFEDMGKLRDQMLSDIDLAQKGLTTPEGKQFGNNFKSRNRDLINQKFQTQMEEIVTQGELSRLKTNHDMMVAGRDSNGLKKLYDGVSGNLLTPDTATFNFAKGVAQIEKLEAEDAAASAIGDAFQVWEGTVTPENLGGDLNTAFDSIQADPRVSAEDKQEVESELKTRITNRRTETEQLLETQREEGRKALNSIFANKKIPTPSEIQAINLPASEEKDYIKWAAAETRRIEDGEDIITNSKKRAELYKSAMSIITGAKTRNDVLNDLNEARFGDDAEIDEKSYQSLLITLEQQYEQGYGQMMSKVNSYAEGILLNPDSLGFIRNAPVRYKTFGDFQQKWLEWVSSKGSDLKLSEIYPEGRRLAASFQMSEKEAERLETEQEEALKAKESGGTKVEQRKEDETIQEYLKRIGK